MAASVGDDECGKGRLRDLCGDENCDGDCGGGGHRNRDCDFGGVLCGPNRSSRPGGSAGGQIGGAHVECGHHHAGGGGGLHSAFLLSVSGVGGFGAGDCILPGVFDLLFCGALSGVECGALSRPAGAPTFNGNCSVRQPTAVVCTLTLHSDFSIQKSLL